MNRFIVMVRAESMGERPLLFIIKSVNYFA